MAHTITVTGCGTSAYNATYSYAGTQNSRPYWSNGTTSYIYSINNAFESVNYWVLSDALTDDPGMFDQASSYALQSDAQVPPKFGLVAVNGATAGDPVLAALEEAVTVTGAGTTAVNQRYAFNTIYNSKAALLRTGAAAYNISYSGAQWEIRASDTIGSGTLRYYNTDDTDTIPTSGWLISSALSPAPSGFTVETLELSTDNVIRVNSIDTAGSWARVGGTDETLDEVIGRDISYPSDPPADEPYIEATFDQSGLFGFDVSGLDANLHQALEIRCRVRGSISSSDTLRMAFDVGANSTADVVVLNNKTTLQWSNEFTYNAATNVGTGIFPIASADLSSILINPTAGTVSDFMRIQLAYVEIDYTYWASGADPSSLAAISSQQAISSAQATSSAQHTSSLQTTSSLQQISSALSTSSQLRAASSQQQISSALATSSAAHLSSLIAISSAQAVSSALHASSLPFISSQLAISSAIKTSSLQATSSAQHTSSLLALSSIAHASSQAALGGTWIRNRPKRWNNRKFPRLLHR